MPALRTIASWHDDPAYIKALATRVNGFGSSMAGRTS